MAIQPPYKGEPLRAAWAADITSAVNDLAPMGANGLLARQGPGGTGYAPLPVNRRGSAGVTLNPFAVRYVESNVDDDGNIPYTGWEIYMPTGCVSVGATCTPLNPRAYRTVDGSTVYETGWYRLPAPDTPSAAKSWPVVVHAKCCAALSGVDTFTDWPKKYLWAEIQKDAEDVTQSDRETDKDDVGDTFSSTVGTVVWTVGDDSEMQSSYLHSVKVPIHVSASTGNQFELYFAFEVDEDDLTIDLDRLFVRTLSFSAAGTTFYADGLKELQKTDESIYLKITALTKPYTAQIVVYSDQTVSGTTLTASQQVEDARQDGEIYVLLYKLKNAHVVVNSLASLQNIQIYQ